MLKSDVDPNEDGVIIELEDEDGGDTQQHKNF
jgi:hypothetical protein